MDNGHRKHERLAATHLKKGTICLDRSQRCFQVEKVRDVSPFGIGLIVNGDINVGEKVRMKFPHNHSQIQMYGHVVWSGPAETNPESVGKHHFSRLGISLN